MKKSFEASPHVIKLALRNQFLMALAQDHWERGIGHRTIRIWRLGARHIMWGLDSKLFSRASSWQPQSEAAFYLES